MKENNLPAVFKFEGHQVRTIVRDDQPWWVAKDVCDALEIKNASQATKKLDDDERSMFNIGRQGNIIIVNEFGLYSLCQTSRKPESRCFRRWINHEVLPAIMKTGRYEAPRALPIDDPDVKTRYIALLERHVALLESRRRRRGPVIDPRQTTLPIAAAPVITPVPAATEPEQKKNRAKSYHMTKYERSKIRMIKRLDPKKTIAEICVITGRTSNTVCRALRGMRRRP